MRLIDCTAEALTASTTMLTLRLWFETMSALVPKLRPVR